MDNTCDIVYCIMYLLRKTVSFKQPPWEPYHKRVLRNIQTNLDITEPLLLRVCTRYREHRNMQVTPPCRIHNMFTCLAGLQTVKCGANSNIHSRRVIPLSQVKDV